VSLKDLLKSKATPESWTLGHGAPGDPHAMEAGEPPVVHSGTFVTYEKTDVNTAAVLRLGSIVILITVVAALATLGIFRLLARWEARNDPAPPPMGRLDPNRRPPEPRLQTTPTQDYTEQRARERQLLDSYGVDREQATVHIPIDEAIKRYVQQAQARPVAAPSAPPAPAAPGGTPR
jgi:hypothetical protein